jgi:preprotein translocase SecE subunit
MAAVTKSNDREKAMADEELPDEADSSEQPPKRSGGAPSGGGTPRGPKPRAVASSPNFFTIYKKGQGYWTRMGTAIGAGFLGVMVAFELYSQIPTFMHGDAKHDKHVALVIALVFLAAYVIWAFWYTNKPSTVDFLVATDSEMKKVNWTTRKELIGSTKIVILFMFLIAIYLFVCDLLFGGFFKLIHVLKTVF